jgi:hypothetical protein
LRHSGSRNSQRQQYQKDRNNQPEQQKTLLPLPDLLSVHRDLHIRPAADS